MAPKDSDSTTTEGGAQSFTHHATSVTHPTDNTDDPTADPAGPDPTPPDHPNPNSPDHPNPATSRPAKRKAGRPPLNRPKIPSGKVRTALTTPGRRKLWQQIAEYIELGYTRSQVLMTLLPTAGLGYAQLQRHITRVHAMLEGDPEAHDFVVKAHKILSQVAQRTARENNPFAAIKAAEALHRVASGPVAPPSYIGAQVLVQGAQSLPGSPDVDRLADILARAGLDPHASQPAIAHDPMQALPLPIADHVNPDTEE